MSQNLDARATVMIHKLSQRCGQDTKCSIDTGDYEQLHSLVSRFANTASLPSPVVDYLAHLAHHIERWIGAAG